MIKPKTNFHFVSLGARVPADLKRIVADYCQRHGVKLQFFVTAALREKLAEMEQDAFDGAVLDERLKNAQFTAPQTLRQYIQNRKKNG